MVSVATVVDANAAINAILTPEELEQVSNGETAVIRVNVVMQGHDAPEEEKALNAGTCPICGFCSQPLGICIFIWLPIIVIVVAGVAAFLIIRHRRKSKNTSN